MVFFAKGATPGAWADGKTDGWTDGGEFNSPPSSLREAGDKNRWKRHVKFIHKKVVQTRAGQTCFYELFVKLIARLVIFPNESSVRYHSMNL